MPLDPALLDRFHRTLVDEIRRSRPEYLRHSFRVSEIYEDLVPYRTHRDAIGVAMNGDYEDALLRLLGGQGDYMILESDRARREIGRELESKNPNTSLFREFASVSVRLNPERLAPPGDGVPVDDDGVGETPPATSGGPDDVSGQGLYVDEEDDPRGVDVPPMAEIGGRRWSVERTDDVSSAGDHGEPGSGGTHPVGVGGVEAGPPSVDASSDPVAGSPPSAGACPWCAERLPDRGEMNYCPHCGGDLRTAPCPACAEPLEVTWRFCVACGTEVRPD